MEINEMLKSRRIELTLTMKEVADQVGVNEATISRWESGEIANMRRDRILAYAKALKISPAVIMGWDEEQKKVADKSYDELKTCFEALNHEGRNHLLEYAKMLSGNSIFAKDTVLQKEKAM